MRWDGDGKKGCILKLETDRIHHGPQKRVKAVGPPWLCVPLGFGYIGCCGCLKQNHQSIRGKSMPVGSLNPLPQSAHRKERGQLQHCRPHKLIHGLFSNPAGSTMGNGPATCLSQNQSQEINHDRNLELSCQEFAKGCLMWACHFKEIAA